MTSRIVASIGPATLATLPSLDPLPLLDQIQPAPLRPVPYELIGRQALGLPPGLDRGVSRQRLVVRSAGRQHGEPGLWS